LIQRCTIDFLNRLKSRWGHTRENDEIRMTKDEGMTKLE